MARDYYKIMLVGSSGKGKTYSFRNLNPETTGFINVEDKPLPYKNKYKYHTRCTTHIEVLKALIEYGKNPEINCIVVDSFSQYMDYVLKIARETKKGFDIWNLYNEEIAKFAQYIKAIQKEIFVTAHYEILNIEAQSEKRIKVKGKEVEGQVEKDYTIVLYADNKFNEKGIPEYYLILAGEGLSAKCPPDIFGDHVYKIQNDANYILEKIKEFTN